MTVHTKVLKFKTKKYLEFVDLTDKIEAFLKKLAVKAGTVTVFSRHTTLAVRVNEREKGFFKDFAEFMDRLIPEKSYYRHNDLGIRTENLVCSVGATDCLNGHSHCQHLLMGASESVPILNGKMALGTWQRIFAIELDSTRPREVVVQVVGE